jgi:hypothetical protein
MAENPQQGQDEFAQYKVTAPLTDNPNGEGTYHMYDAKGSGVGIPYSQVPTAKTQGYAFGIPAEEQRYQKDYDYAQKPKPAQQAAPGEDEFAQYKKAAAPPTGSLAPQPHTVANWLENAANDVRFGGDRTAVGKGLMAVGANKNGLYGGVSPATAELVGGPFIGPFVAAHGVTQIPSHPVRGINETLRGVGQTLAPVLGVTNPEFLPALTTGGAVNAGVQTVAKPVAKVMGANDQDASDYAELAGNASMMFGVPAVNKALPKVGEFLENNAKPIAKTVGTTSGLVGAAGAIKEGHPFYAPIALGAGAHYGAKVAPVIEGLGKGMQSLPELPPLYKTLTPDEEFTNPAALHEQQIHDALAPGVRQKVDTTGLKDITLDDVLNTMNAVNAKHEYQYGEPKPVGDGQYIYSPSSPPPVGTRPQPLKSGSFGSYFRMFNPFSPATSEGVVPGVIDKYTPSLDTPPGVGGRKAQPTTEATPAEPQPGVSDLMGKPKEPSAKEVNDAKVADLMNRPKSEAKVEEPTEDRGAFKDLPDKDYRALAHRLGSEDNRAALQDHPQGVELAQALTKGKNNELVDLANENGGEFDASKMGRSVAQHGKSASQYKADVVKFIIDNVDPDDILTKFKVQ